MEAKLKRQLLASLGSAADEHIDLWLNGDESSRQLKRQADPLTVATATISSTRSSPIFRDLSRHKLMPQVKQSDHRRRRTIATACKNKASW